MANDLTRAEPSVGTAAAPAGRPTSVRYFILASVALAASTAYLTRHCIVVANTTIQGDLQFTTEQMGWILAVFNFGYFAFQVPSGALGNRLGTRLSLPSLSVLWSMLAAWTGSVSGYIPMMLSRAVYGAAQAGLVPNTAKVLHDWIPVSRRGFAGATIGAAMSIGAVITMGLTAVLLEHFHWRTVYYVFSLVGIVWALGYFVFARTKPAEHPWVNSQECALIAAGRDDNADPGNADKEPGSAGNESVGDDGKKRSRWLTADVALAIATSPNMWAICGQSFFRSAGYGLFVSWFPAFLEKGYGVSRQDSGLMNMSPLLATIVGTMTGGLIVDWLLKRTHSKRMSRCGVATVALALCGLCSLFATGASTPSQLVAVIAGAAFLSGLAYSSTWAITMDVAGDQTPVVIGVNNMASTGGAFAMAAALGYLIGDIERTGGDWNQVIYVFAAVHVVGSLCWLAIRPEVPVTQRHASFSQSR